MTATEEPHGQARRHPDGQGQFLTAAQLAARWGVSRQHVYNMMRQGLPSVTLGRSRRFRLDAVDAWIDHRTEAA